MCTHQTPLNEERVFLEHCNSILTFRANLFARWCIVIKNLLYPNKSNSHRYRYCWNKRTHMDGRTDRFTEQTNRRTVEWLMTLFSYIKSKKKMRTSQKKRIAIEKSTNGFIVLWLKVFFTRASNINVSDKPSNERANERNCVVLRESVRKAPPQFHQIITANAWFPQFLCAHKLVTWKITVGRLFAWNVPGCGATDEAEREWKMLRCVLHCAKWYKCCAMLSFRFIVILNLITCAGSTGNHFTNKFHSILDNNI